MSSRPRRFEYQPRTKTAASLSLATFEEGERAAKLLEDLLPKAKNKNERKWRGELIRSYRAAATRLLRRTWSADDGQDIAE